MDSNDLEKERGITILAKQPLTAVITASTFWTLLDTLTLAVK